MKTTLTLITVLLLLVACKTKKEITYNPLKPVEEVAEPVNENAGTFTFSDSLSSVNGSLEIGTSYGDVEIPQTALSISGIIRDQKTGEPVKDGEIVFIPKVGKERFRFPIVNGKYQAELVPGCYMVKFNSSVPMRDEEKEIICISNVKTNSTKSGNNQYDFNPKKDGPSSMLGGEKEAEIPNTTGSTGEGPKVPISEEETDSKVGATEEPPPNPTTSEISSIPSVSEVAAGDVNRIATGKFRYDPIPPLPIDTVYIFQLEIVPGQDSAKFTAVTGNKTGKAIQKKIRIASEMSIHIISPNKAFEIQQISDSVQVIDPISSTVWRWSVIPRKLGKHPVIVSIDILTKGEETGETRKKSIEVFNEQVEVYVVEKEPTLAEADTDEKTFNWLFAAIPLALVLLGGLFFFFWKKQKKEKEQEWIIAPNAASFLLEVENKIADGDTETAIQKLLDFFKESEELHSQLLNLSSQYQTFRQEEMQGLEPPKKTLNRINLAIIEMVNGLQSKLRHA